MPGPVSDSYDPEWGTAANGDAIRTSLQHMHAQLGGVLSYAAPMYVLDLLDADLPRPITATLTEKEWRLLRFACERAAESV